MVRFCKRIEPKGLNALKIKLSTEVESYKNANIDLLNETIIQASDTYEDIKNKITKVSLNSIQETELLLDQKLIENVAQLIMKAVVIDLYGDGEYQY